MHRALKSGSAARRVSQAKGEGVRKFLDRLLKEAEERIDTKATFFLLHEEAQCTTKARKGRPMGDRERRKQLKRLERLLAEARNKELRQALDGPTRAPVCGTCGLYHACAAALSRKAQALVLLDDDAKVSFALMDPSEAIQCINLVPLASTTASAFGKCTRSVQPVAYSNKVLNDSLKWHKWATASTYCPRKQAMRDLLASLRGIESLEGTKLCCAVYWSSDQASPDMQFGVSGSVDAEDMHDDAKCCFQTAAIREVWEELGLRVTREQLLAVHLGIFVFRVMATERPAQEKKQGGR